VNIENTNDVVTEQEKISFQLNEEETNYLRLCRLKILMKSRLKLLNTGTMDLYLYNTPPPNKKYLIHSMIQRIFTHPGLKLFFGNNFFWSRNKRRYENPAFSTLQSL